MDCFKNDQVMHTKFVLKQKRDDSRKVFKYKTRLVVCVNKDESCQEDTFSAAAHHFIVKLTLCHCVEHGLKSKHIDFENAFPNGMLER